MPQPLAVALMILAAILVLAAMGAAWRRRVARGLELVPELPGAPEDRGTALHPAVDGIYVSTTAGGSRYERVAAHTLGSRSTVTVEVTEAGVLLRRPAERDVFVPADDLLEVGTSSGMVGKYPGGEGLVVLRWRIGERMLDTGLRLARRDEQPGLLTSLRGLTAAHGTTTDDSADALRPGTDDEGLA